MALANYSDLKTSVLSWLNRTGDTYLSSQASDIIVLTEARLNRLLLVNERLIEATGTFADPLPVPADLWTVKSIVWETGGGEIPLRAVSLEEYAMHVSSAGYPAVYTEFNGELLIAPTASGDYILRYYAKIPALSDNNTTNWLLTKYPDVYLWGALSEASSFINSDAKVQKFEAKFVTAIAEILRDNESRRLGGSLLRMRAVQ
jgi:hypothetical protein